MKKIKVICPECSGTGMIEINETFIKNNTRGIATLNIAESLICSHSFVACVDKNFKMRDSFVADFMIELPQIKIKEESDIFDKDILNNVDLYLIKINLYADELVKIIHYIFMKKNVLLIKEILSTFILIKYTPLE